MKVLALAYEKIKKEPAPYYFRYSFLEILGRPVRKWIAQVIAPNCVSNHVRVFLYRLCGFKIGKRVFIGMKCYLDDVCYDKLTIGNDVTVSYGVYFACHGKHQNRTPIRIEDGAYIGMRASIISKSAGDEGITIGKKAVVGACTLVNRDIPDDATAVGVPCRIIEK